MHIRFKSSAREPDDILRANMPNDIIVLKKDLLINIAFLDNKSPIDLFLFTHIGTLSFHILSNF